MAAIATVAVEYTRLTRRNDLEALKDTVDKFWTEDADGHGNGQEQDWLVHWRNEDESRWYLSVYRDLANAHSRPQSRLLRNTIIASRSHSLYNNR